MAPIDEGVKANANRIKEIITKKLNEKQRGELQIYFYYDANFGRFYLYINKPNEVKTVRLSKAMAYMLGFEIGPAGFIKNIRSRHGGGYAKYTPDIRLGIHQLYVYMPNIIEPSYLGDKQVPLLRIVNVEKEPNKIAENIYTQEHHHRVSIKRISSIHIDIHSSSGELIRFDWGDVIITLHFRRSIF
jgi:hypothetical protein